MKATMSILGLYRINPEIFSGLTFPEDMALDPDVIEWEILEECAELEILYPDPDYMQLAIAKWAAFRMPSWQRMYTALSAEYNPIYNKDAHINETRLYGARSTTQQIGARSATEENKVSAFNAAGYSNAEQTIATQQAATDTASELAHTDMESRTEQGNIGVTTTQEMINAEMDLRTKWSMYSVICEEFKRKFCLLVY